MKLDKMKRIRGKKIAFAGVAGCKREGNNKCLTKSSNNNTAQHNTNKTISEAAAATTERH